MATDADHIAARRASLERSGPLWVLVVGFHDRRRSANGRMQLLADGRLAGWSGPRWLDRSQPLHARTRCRGGIAGSGLATDEASAVASVAATAATESFAAAPPADNRVAATRAS